MLCRAPFVRSEWECELVRFPSCFFSTFLGDKELWRGIFGGSNALKKGFKGEGSGVEWAWTFLKYVPYQSHQETTERMCMRPRRRAKNTALPRDQIQDCEDRFDNDVAPKTKVKRMLFAARSERGMPIRPFYLRKKCSFAIFHSVSLCGVVRGQRGGAGPTGHAIKWFSRHSTSGWQSDKISSSLSHSPPPCPELQYHVKWKSFLVWEILESSSGVCGFNAVVRHFKKGLFRRRPIPFLQQWAIYERGKKQKNRPSFCRRGEFHSSVYSEQIKCVDQWIFKSNALWLPGDNSGLNSGNGTTMFAVQVQVRFRCF